MSKAIKSIKWNKIYTVSTEGPCNLACLGCGSSRVYKPRTTGELIKDIENGALLGYDRIEIIGGEPTIHKDFLFLFGIAKKKYKHVNLTTNGIMLSDERLARKVLDIVDEVNISLDGHNAEMHEAWTRKAGSFDLTVAGIKNCLKIAPKKTSVTNLVWRKNFSYLRELLKFDIELKIPRINILNIQPIGRAKSLYGELAVPLNELNKFDESLHDLLDSFEDVDFEDFPYCIFSEKMRLARPKNVHIVDIAGQFFVDDVGKINAYDLFMVHNLGAGVDSTSKTQKDIVNIASLLDDYRVYLKECEGCEFTEQCNGIFSGYLEAFSADKANEEIRNIKISNFSK